MTPSPPLDNRLQANYRLDVTNQSYAEAAVETINFFAQGGLFLITSPDSPFSLSVSCRRESIFALLGNHEDDQLDSTLAVSCITVCRTGNKSLIRSGRVCLSSCVFTFTRASDVFVSVRGLICSIPAWKLNIHIFCLFLSFRRKNKKHPRHNLRPILVF